MTLLAGRLLDYVNKKEKGLRLSVNFLNPASNLTIQTLPHPRSASGKAFIYQRVYVVQSGAHKRSGLNYCAPGKETCPGKFLLLEYRNGTAIMMQIKENENSEIICRHRHHFHNLRETVMSASPVLLKTFTPFSETGLSTMVLSFHIKVPSGLGERGRCFPNNMRWKN